LAIQGVARHGWSVCRRLLIAIGGVGVFLSSCRADGPFFVTYTTQMEELHTLDIDMRSITGKPKGANRFAAAALEFEYGATNWWTTEFYVDGTATQSESTIFTGFRWENRFRLLPRRHWINPVLYVEFEDLNGADKTLLEVVGHDGLEQFDTPVSVARREKNREVETKLILDSQFKGWTLAENLITEKNFAGGPWEFGYAVGLTRFLGRNTQPTHCRFCRQAIAVGVEVYGGVGTTSEFGLQNTSHYVGPAVAWIPREGTAIYVSPNFGLTDTSARFLLRFGVSYEIDDFGRGIGNIFRKLR
jgi:hypothetical protein